MSATSSRRLMTRSEPHSGLLPDPYESGARTWNFGDSSSMSPRHCDEVLALEWTHTTPRPVPASRKKGSGGRTYSARAAPLSGEELVFGEGHDASGTVDYGGAQAGSLDE